MRGQAERLLDRADASLLHDELAEVNEAVYFHEFAAHAARHELQYLAEADFFEMQIGAAPGRPPTPCSRSRIRCAASSTWTSSRARMFRQTLLCRAEQAIDRTPRPAVVERLAFSTQAQVRGERGAGRR